MEFNFKGNKFSAHWYKQAATWEVIVTRRYFDLTQNMVKKDAKKQTRKIAKVFRTEF